MSNITKFEFQGHEVRVVVVEDGDGAHEEWVAKDVCEALELRGNTPWDQLDEDERGTAIVGTLGGRQEVSTVTEAGLYALILRSRKPAAKTFSRWVTHEVLPTIRRTGCYVRQGDEARVIELLTARLEQAELLNVKQTEVIALLSDQVRQLVERVDSIERAHPFGMLGDDARVLRGQMTSVARIRRRLGDSRSILVLFNELDGEVRDAVGYPKRAGSTWERCPGELRGKAFSLVARMLAKAERRAAIAVSKNGPAHQTNIIDLLSRRSDCQAR